jgi:hypothetical protein
MGLISICVPDRSSDAAKYPVGDLPTARSEQDVSISPLTTNSPAGQRFCHAILPAVIVLPAFWQIQNTKYPSDTGTTTVFTAVAGSAPPAVTGWIFAVRIVSGAPT